MRIALAFITLLAVFDGGKSAMAKELAEASVVKVRSYICATGGQVRVGSGVLVQDAGQLLVVSSSHVPWHGRAADGICHQLSTVDGLQVSMELLGASVFNDLALFSIAPSDAAANLGARALPVASFSDPLTPSDDPVMTVGFPFAATSVTRYPGILVDPDSPRTSLALVHVAEIDGLSEYGMSGGGVFDADGRLVGIVSHQYLNIPDDDDAAATVVDQGQDGGVEGLIRTLAIPRQEVAMWISEVMQKPPRALAMLDLKDQLAGASSLSLDGLVFKESHCLPISHWAPAGGQGAGVGGQGAGVGGDEGAGAANAGACRIQIAAASPGSRSASWPFPVQSLLSDVHSKLIEGHTLTVTAMQNGAQTRHPENLLDFLVLAKAGFRPLLTEAWEWTYLGRFTAQGASGATTSYQLPVGRSIGYLAITNPVSCGAYNTIAGIYVQAQAGSVQNLKTGLSEDLAYMEQDYSFNGGQGTKVDRITFYPQFYQDVPCVYSVWYH